MSTRVRPAKSYRWAPTWPSGRVLGWLLVVAGGLSILEALFQLDRVFSATSATSSGFGPRLSYSSPIAIAAGPLGIACQVLWLIWQHRATANLWARGVQGLRFTPGWAVGWWFVPFAWWVQPFRAVRELSRHAGRAGLDAAPPVVGDGVLAAWWATYVGAQLAAIPAIVIVIRTIGPALSGWSGTGTPTIFYEASDLRTMAAWLALAATVRIASALLAAKIVWSISKAEDRAPLLAGIPPRPDL